MVVTLIKFDPVVKGYIFDLRSRAGKVVEVVGLLLGFIVIAVADIKIDDYVNISDYLKVGFSLTLYFLLVSAFLGLFVLFDDNVYYDRGTDALIKSLNKMTGNLKFSILFCYLGLFFVVCIVMLIVSNSLHYTLVFIFLCIVTFFILSVILFLAHLQSLNR